MATRSWVGGSGSWSDTNHWSSDFVGTMSGKCTGSGTNTLIVTSVTGTLVAGMTVYANSSGTTLGTLSFTGTGTGGAGTYSVSSGVNTGSTDTPLSAGTIGASVPTDADDVYFIQKFGVTLTTVIRNTAATYSKSLTVGGTINISFTSSITYPWYINGSISLSNFSGCAIGNTQIYLGSGSASQTYTVSTSTVSMPYFIIGHDQGSSTYSNCSSCTWNFSGNILFDTGLNNSITLVAGSIGVLSGTVITTKQFISTTNTYTRGIVFSGGTFDFNQTTPALKWDVDATNFTCTGTGVIKLPASSTSQFNGGGASYSGVSLTGQQASVISINGSNTFYSILNTGTNATFTFQASSTTTVTNLGITGNTLGNGAGTESILQSSVVGTQFNITTASPSITLNACCIIDSNATPSSVFNGNQCINYSNNTGWTFSYGDRFWVGGTGSNNPWYTVSNWANYYINSITASCTGAGVLTVTAVTGYIQAGMKIYYNNNASTLGTISFISGGGTGGVGTYQVSAGANLASQAMSGSIAASTAPDETLNAYFLQGYSTNYIWPLIPSTGAFCKNFQASSSSTVIIYKSGSAGLYVTGNLLASPQLNTVNGSVPVYFGTLSASATKSINLTAGNLRNIFFGYESGGSTYSNCQTCTWNITNNGVDVFGSGVGTPNIELIAGTMSVDTNLLLREGFASLTPTYTRQVVINNNSTITTRGFYADILWNVNKTNFTYSGTGTLQNNGTSKIFNGGGADYSGLTLYIYGTSQTYYINGSNTFKSIINGGNSSQTWVFESGTATSVETINTSDVATNWRSSVTGSQFNLYKTTSGFIYFKNLTLKDSNVTPLATWYAMGSCTDYGNNTGWNFVATTGLYWVGASNAYWWVNSSWSFTSGGASGAPPPTQYEPVYFDQAGTFNVDINQQVMGYVYAKSINVTNGSYTFVANSTGGTYIYTTSLNLNSSTRFTNAAGWNLCLGALNIDGANQVLNINLNGNSLLFANPCDWNIGYSYTGSSSGTSSTATWKLTSDATMRVLNGYSGYFDTQGYALTIQDKINNGGASGSYLKTFYFRNSNVRIEGVSSYNNMINWTSAGGGTLDWGTSNLYLVYGVNPITPQTFYNVTFKLDNGYTLGETTGTYAPLARFGSYIKQVNTFNNLTLELPTTGSKTFDFIFDANQTITGTLIVTNSAPNRRVLLRATDVVNGATLNTQTINAPDTNFRTINITGSAAGSTPLRAGNCGGNTGLNFDTKTVYYNPSTSTAVWASNSWATTDGGTTNINNIPLPQDTAMFTDGNTLLTAITVNMYDENSRGWDICNIDATGRTIKGITFAQSSSYNSNFYGDVLLSTSGVMYCTGWSAPYFVKRGGIQLLQNVNNAVGTQRWDTQYIFALDGELKISGNIYQAGYTYHNGGTLNLNGSTWTQSYYYCGETTSAYNRTIAFGSGGIFRCIAGSNVTCFKINTNLLSVSGSGKFYVAKAYDPATYHQMNISGSFNFTNVTIEFLTNFYLQTDSGSYNSFEEIKYTGTNPVLVLFWVNATYQFNKFSLNGVAGAQIALRNNTTGYWTLYKPTGSVIVQYCKIRNSTALGAAKFYALISNGNVDEGGNTNWNFGKASTNMMLIFNP